MNVRGLKIAHVKSHLQMYRSKKLDDMKQENSTLSSSVVSPTMPQIRGPGRDMFYHRPRLPYFGAPVHESPYRFHSLMHRETSQPLLDLRQDSFRSQEWAFKHVHRMASRTGLFDVRDVINGRPGLFPDESHNAIVTRKILTSGNLDCSRSSSQPMTSVISISRPASVGANNNCIRTESGGLKINQNPFRLRVNDSLSTQLESAYHLKLLKQPGAMWANTIKGESSDIEMMEMMKERYIFPNLQLSLSSNFGRHGVDMNMKGNPVNKEEAHRELKLSLQPPIPMLKERSDETNKGSTIPSSSNFLFSKKDSNNSSRNKRAEQGLSTLNLTMSIGALE
ncbi:hypothetical protein QJS04_geneDACA019255 [Acorus gramineus]|uniref:Uncharacterized protein n=1 Tax=Acorus gramineus TaxID=55184 RepID=A0AAV9A3B0_ACOGR|nr:hypothetical protein QJS04_geneDACA019255 [Acorus gramineus]